MNVTRISADDRDEADHPVQVGTPLLSAGVESAFDGNTAQAAEVTFRPGERTKFHAHEGVQILYVTEGTGVVGTREGEREVSEGDLVVFEPGEEHWHGTGEDAESVFSHVYFLAEPDDAELAIQEAPEIE
ncbi:cupin [Halosimplex carlsbadense 2-9-1]|uniref:Cupin n=1 Tax=Halosimplex carlsbadense 2-9-1 TaxID=797114 RepID=M0CMQ5_9EURY|nr:cupin domain-containing protein [Halosimplex carlsbadense]ELZ23687.1 cupin [Halosimplex carlsbadense 2-9-1]